MNLSPPTDVARRSQLLAAALATYVVTPCMAQPTTDEVLDAILARGAAIFSAKIEFEVSSMIEKSGREMKDDSRQFALSVTGQDWILRYKGSPNFVMNVKDATTHFYQTQSETTGVYRSLQMSAPATIDEMLGRDYTFAIARNGTLWYRSQLVFVDQQRHNVERRQGEVIDGHPTVMLRWRVTMKNLGNAFVVVPPKIREDLAGYLEIYAAPSLDYALPRIDYVTPDGELVRRYESSNFTEVDDGLFFPMATRCTAYGTDERRLTAFAVRAIEHVNQDLPDEEFAIQIPPDTRVRDSRPGTPQVVFHLGNQEELDDLTQAIEPSDQKSKRFSFRMACLTANGLLVVLLLVAWIRRQCR